MKGATMTKHHSTQSEIKERPIIFSAHSVRAILSETKTQTRRVMKPQPSEWVKTFGYTCFTPPGHVSGRGLYGDDGPAEKFFKCPYGTVGDRLWVKETWCQKVEWGVLVYNAEGNLDPTCAHYEADGYYVQKVDDDGFAAYRQDGSEASPWGSPLFMPRWASRITLELTGVRVERLHEITEDDAMAEGVDAVSVDAVPRQASWTRRQDFARLWDILNEKRGYSWESNPFVWVLNFKMTKGDKS